MERCFATSVKRYLLGESEVLIGDYEDATVRDQGDGGFIRAPMAMLRAYKNDVTFLDTQYPEDYHFDEKRGFLVDCDGDIALKRVRGYVLRRYSFGDSLEHWEMMVSIDEDGWGNGPFQPERWHVSIAEELKW